MELVDPLYIDKKRLDFYFEQISPPVKYDKVPEWSAEIGPIGPKGGGKQARFARCFTTYEKISKLTEHLEHKGWMVRGRPDKHWYWLSKTDKHNNFWLETCQATRVSIPTKQLDSSPGSLNLWISLARQATSQERARPSSLLGNLYLFENYQGNDKDKPYAHSAYSTLGFLLKEHDEQYEGEVIAPAFEHRLRDQKSFSVDPVVALRQLGARVGEVHDIRCLYRLRMTFLDSDSGPKQQRVAVFGYPVFIEGL